MSLFDFLFETTDDIASADLDILEESIEFDAGINDIVGIDNEDQVLYALDRMTNDVDAATLEEAAEYFQEASFDQDSFNGVVSNLKGIHGEIQVLEELQMRPDFDAHYVMPKSTIHESVDIYGIDENGDILEKYQVKMSLDKSYISKALQDLPEDVKIICPSEIASEFDNDRIIDVGVRLDDVEAGISNLCEVLSSSEPWENELSPTFDEWIEDEYIFDFSDEYRFGKIL